MNDDLNSPDEGWPSFDSCSWQNDKPKTLAGNDTNHSDEGLHRVIPKLETFLKPLLSQNSDMVLVRKT